MGIDIDRIYIVGQWVSPSSTDTIAVQSPATGKRVSSVISASERDVDRAVAAARAAFDDPSGRSNWEPADRAAVLAEFAGQYQLAVPHVVRTVCQQNGMPISQAVQLEGMVPGVLLNYYAGLIEQLSTGESCPPSTDAIFAGANAISDLIAAWSTRRHPAPFC